MSLIKCPECKKKISSTAVACPKCGYDMSNILIKSSSTKQKKIKDFANKICDSKVFICLMGIATIFALFCFSLFVLWLFEIFCENNSILALVVMIIIGNIGGYFFLYKRSSNATKIFLIIFMTIEVIVGCSLILTYTLNTIN